MSHLHPLTISIISNSIFFSRDKFSKIFLMLAFLLLMSNANLLAQRELWTYSGVADPAWNNQYTWTTVENGGDIVPGDPWEPVFPEPGDILHITNNITVYLHDDIDLANIEIIIYNGGLDLRTHNITGISQLTQQTGSNGRLRIGKEGYFPAVATDNFTAEPGSTVEYYNFTGTLPTAISNYNNLLLRSTDGNNHTITLGHDVTVNNDLSTENTVSGGSLTLTIGNSTTVLNLITKNLTVGENTNLRTGTSNAIHNLTIGGNLTNNGSIRLTNQGTRYRTSTNGAAELTFTGTNNNTFAGDGTELRLYRLIVDKGTNQTFILDANPQNLELWYRTDQGNGGSDPNPIINKALWIKNGTLKLGDNINIPKLADRDEQNSGNDFFIPLNGCLWIDGATVHITDNDGNSSNTGLTLIGKLLVTAGEMRTFKAAGIVFREQAVVEIRGGTVTISQFRRSTSGGEHLASFNMTGGTLNVTGEGESNNSYSRFSLPLATQSFRMSGGTINLTNPTGAGILALGSDPANYNASGGTVNISHTGTSNIASTVPLFNLNLQDGTLAIHDGEGIGLQPLKVNNNLTLSSGTILNMNNEDLWIAGNMTLENTATYNHGSNTTRFFKYGTANNAGTITNNSGTTPLSFNNVVLAKVDATSTYNTAKTVLFPTSGIPATDIEGSLSFDSPYQTLNLNNSQLRIQGDIFVNQTSRILNDPANGIQLQPATAQAQSLYLSRLESHNNFELNNTEGAALQQNARMESLTLSVGSLYIANRRLILNQPVLGSGFSNSKMISTNGSSGELRYNYSGPGAGTYFYPVGSGATPLAEGEEEFTWEEDFSRNVFSTAPQWTSTPVVNTSSWDVDAGSARFRANETHEARMETPAIDLSGYSSVVLTFQEQRQKQNGRTDRLVVEYWNGASWTVLETYTNDNNWTDRTITLPAGALVNGFKLGFRALSDRNNTETRVDNVHLTNVIEAGADQTKFTPFTLSLAGGGSFSAGDNLVGVTPVNKMHPLVNATQHGDEVMLYYWKTSVNLPDPLQGTLDAEYEFNFLDQDAENIGGNGRAARLINNIWTLTNTFYRNPNRITFQAGLNAGDFTAGSQNAFSSGEGLTTFYSRNATSGGNWEDGNTWSTDDQTGHDGGGSGSTPDEFSLIIIAPNHSVNITTDDRLANVVQIYGAGTLDIGTTTGHQFEQIRGDGTLRTASATLPATSDNLADFTETDQSTIEFYGTTNYTLPSLATYYNLLISGTGTKAFASTNLNIRNRLQVSDNATAIISGDINGNLDIEGEINITTGATLTVPATTNQRNINTTGITINNATFLAETGTGSTHNLNIEGGGMQLTGTALANLYTAGNNVNLTLGGPGNTAIASTAGNNISLNRLIINKASIYDEISVTANLILNGPAGGVSGTKPLGLQTGTLILERSEGTESTDITLSSGGGDFTIPSTAALTVSGTSADYPNIVRTTGNTGITLDGLLSLTNTGQALFNGGINDIVYTSSGNAVLEVADNAILNVGGQVRRSTTEPGTNLKYTQTGGTTSIGTQGATTGTRGVFEIANTGSSFTHTGGILAISRSSGNAGGDIILNPEASSISGSSTLTVSAATTAQPITINSAIPLNNLTIEGTNSPTVSPVSQRLNLLGDFIINNGATYTSNDLSLSIAGNYLNDGIFTSSTTDTTFFNGEIQTLSGTGTNNFYHLVSEPLTSLDIQREITINGNLAISSGEFNDNGNTISAKGHISNSGTHNGTGRILLDGTTRQDLGGGGTFSNLEFSNAEGARLTGNINLAGNLHLNEGTLNIRNYRLILSENSNLTATGEFDETKMIQTSGDMGDAGIEKTFPAGTMNFLYPVGSYGKYTPVSLSFDNTFSGGTMTIYPVRNVHPTISGGGDPTRVLQYYWGLSTENITSATGTMIFNYDPADIRGDINQYYSGHLLMSTDTWTKSAMSEDDKTNNYITFVYSGAGNDQLDGSYLAGEDDAIPSTVAAYSTIASGNWDTPEIWNTGAVPPQGVIAVIQADHTVNINTDRKRVYRTRINGRLELDPTTTAHNFGLVEGTGTLALQKGNLPPGKWAENFLTCEGGTVEFGGLASYNLDDRYLHYRNLTITGSGIKTTPNIADFVICGNLNIQTGATFRQRHRTTYRGDIISSGSFIHMGWWRYINGRNSQIISGNFQGINRFKSTQFINPNGYDITADIDIYDNLELRFGQFRNEGYQFSFLNTKGLAFERGGTDETYITGRYRRLLEPSTTETYYFPVGKPGLKKITAISEPATSGDDLWAIEYFNVNPDNIGLNTGYVLSPIEAVSNSEYWIFNGPDNGSAKIKISLTGTSDIVAALGDENKTDLRIVRWHSGNNQWEIVGDDVAVSGTIDEGYLTTSSPVVFNGEDQYFTLGSINEVNIPTAQIVSEDATLCNSGNYDLDISLTGDQNWILEYRINGGSIQTTGTITQTPHNIIFEDITETSTFELVKVYYEDSTPGNVFGNNVSVTVIPNADIFNVGGGGDICGIQSTEITLDGSQSGYTYQLFRNGEGPIMEREGTGSTLSFSPISVEGDYSITAFATGYVECITEMMGQATVNIVEGATAEITGLETESIICEGEAVVLSLEITASEPFDLTIAESSESSARFFNLTHEDLTFMGGNTYTFNVDPPPVWVDQGNLTPGLSEYNYSITELTDNSGCPTNIGGEASVNVYKIPETGPQYHIPNTFGN